MAKKPARITFRTLLLHMQGMEQRLRSEVKHGLSDVCSELKDFERKTLDRFDRLDRKFEWVSFALRNIDERLDDIEMKQIPALKKAVGIQ